MATIDIYLDDAAVREALTRLQQLGTNLRPAMRKIAGTMLTETEDNFQEQGRPRWAPLAESTIKQRRGSDKQDASFRILQNTGQLASSISTRHDESSATIGSNKVYAAIHQFGGKAGRNQSVDIPARPFLPIVDGQLQTEVKEEVLETIKRHFERIVSS